ncbi:MAG: response regulator [Lachnospiraceae bacterium]|nr:response regulator [Lachnospiraceae bacterium]
MKSWCRRGITAAVLCVVGAAVALMAHFYFRYISQQIYEECADHLVEVYSQVNHNFVSFLEKNWGNLEDWVHHIQIEDEEGVVTFLHGRQQNWKFSQFYFLSSDGQGLSPEGTVEQFNLESASETLFHKQERAMFMETLSSGQAVTLFAIPVEKGTYRGFDYNAIAVSYSNADIVASLNVNAFSDQSMCLVIYTDGSVLLSTQPSGSAFGNYLSYLNAGSDLSPERLSEIRKDWENGVSGVVRCEIGDVSHYISYQPVGYESCILLGVVPESAASASMLEIQKATVDILIKVSVLLGALIVLWIVLRYQKKTQKSSMELRYRERMFDMLSNNVDDIFLMVDSRTLRLDYLSPNVERLLGISQNRISENIHLLEDSCASEGGSLTIEDLKVIPSHGSQSWEREHIHQTTGERRWFYETVYRENIQGVEKFVVVMSDRTRERNMSQNLEEALTAAKSANEAKSHFLSNMSHDIRTPMNAIVGFANLLSKNAGNEEKVREYTRKISASSQHLLSLINDVLDMSKIESGKTSLNVAVFHLPELMEELYTILLPQAKAKGQFFEFRTKGRPAERLLGDKLRLNQILINLLSNAIKYTQEGGEITCTVEELPKVSPQFSNLRFVVADNGLGMSEEFLKTVFDPFSREVNSTTSGIQGTGLGMAITKNLVELMGGVIVVTSRQGEGSVFTVDLSFALPEQTDGEDLWVSHGISRMLVVDDEEEICLDVQAMMQEIGVNVSYEIRGAAAVETAIQAQEKNEGFHVILLDWLMPGQNGVETVRQIRKKVPEDIPILVMTSYDWGDIEDEARAAGVDAFMPKPFFVSTFQQTLENLYANREKKEVSPDLEGILKGLRFLVAEDNELNAEILFEVMNMEGARCELAVNGQEAVEMFQRSEPEYYDMILMDVQMPVMNGYEATRNIRSSAHPRAGSIPIVAMTANAFAEDVRNALDAGMNGHLSKPIDMDAVKALLGHLRNEQDLQAASIQKEKEGSNEI